MATLKLVKEEDGTFGTPEITIEMVKRDTPIDHVITDKPLFTEDILKLLSETKEDMVSDTELAAILGVDKI